MTIGGWVWRGLAVVALAIGAIALWSAWGHEGILALQRGAGPVPFFAAMALLPAIGVPITPFFVLAGATFGRALGLLGSLAALALNLAVCYWIARSRLRSWIESLMRRFEYELPDFTKEDTRPTRFTIAVKLTPGLPAFVKNYGLGIAGVPFGVYFGLSMLITGAYAASLIVLGQSMFQHRITRIVVVAVALVGGTYALWRWSRRRALEDSD